MTKKTGYQRTFKMLHQASLRKMLYRGFSFICPGLLRGNFNLDLLSVEYTFQYLAPLRFCQWHWPLFVWASSFTGVITKVRSDNMNGIRAENVNRTNMPTLK